MELKIISPGKDGFIEAIEWNFDELKQELTEKTALYTGLVYDADQIRDAKVDRANLNKFVKALEDKRKEIKAQCLAPYDKFEKQIKELAAIVQEPIAVIDSQVKAFEEKAKEDKLHAIEEYFNTVDCCGFPLEAIYNPKWLNATVTMNSIKADIDKAAENVRADMAIIKALDLYQFEALQVYNTTLDVRAALNESKRLEQVAKDKAEFEAKKAAELEANKKSMETKQAELEALVEEAPVVEEVPEGDFLPDWDNVKSTRTWVSIKANVTPEDLEAIKWFFDTKGIEAQIL